MIDWHSHILPGIDDGSQDAAESISMIGMQASQGVDTVIATPHFYANDESVDAFLKRREQSVALLRSQLPDGSPRIILGAEVRYYQGISQLAELKALRIEGSRLLLLEMPMGHWTECVVRELTALAGKSGMQLILAHIDRYLHLQKKAVWDRLYESGILMQVNASFFTALASRHRAISMLKEGKIHFLGSDCHNMTSRPPRIGKAYEILQKKLGDEYTSQLNEFGNAMLATIKN